MKATKVEIEILKSVADSLEQACKMSDYNSKLRILETTVDVCYNIIKKIADNSEIEYDDKNDGQRNNGTGR